jgi:hypothetical protein
MTRKNTIPTARGSEQILFDSFHDSGPESAFWQTPIGADHYRASKMKPGAGKRFLDKKYGPNGPSVSPRAPAPESIPWQMPLEEPDVPPADARSRALALAELLDRDHA